MDVVQRYISTSTPLAQNLDACLQKCLEAIKTSTRGGTACELNLAARTCGLHWADVSKGNNVGNHWCMVFDISLAPDQTSLVVWGDRIKGGRVLSPATWQRLIRGEGLVRVFPGPLGFAAVMIDGEVVMWGDPSMSGAWTLPNQTSLLLKKERVRRILGNDYGFVALTESNKAISWGRAFGNETVGANVVAASCCAFAAVTSDTKNPVVAWGAPEAGGYNPYTNVSRSGSEAKTNISFTCGQTEVAAHGIIPSKSIPLTFSREQLGNDTSMQSNFTVEEHPPADCITLQCRPYPDLAALKKACYSLAGCTGFEIASNATSQPAEMNVAVYGIATQSVVYNNRGAYFAIDGNTASSGLTADPGFSCTATYGENLWWHVHLGDTFNITVVKVFSRR
eukprot:jgi/Bigna1/130824/aug1.12_g5532